MSLFDLDDNESSSLSSEENAAPTHAASSPTAPVPVLSAEAIHARMGLPGRYSVTAADAAKLAQRQREAMNRRLSNTGAGTASHTEQGTQGSKFGQSIAAALQLRKADQEQLALERIRKQREHDAHTPALVEKDLDVGIFVTPAYKQLLKKHYKKAAKNTRLLGTRTGRVTVDAHSDASTGDEESDEENATAQDDEQEEEDALDAYLRQFARPTAAVDTSPTDDFYTTSMRQALRDGAEHHQQSQNALPDLNGSEATRSSDGNPPGARGVEPPAQSTSVQDIAIAPPSLDELQRLLGLPAESTDQQPAVGSTPVPPTATPAEGHAANATEAPRRALPDASREHLTTLFRAREARRRKRADEALVAGCAQRCDARILQRIRLT